MKLDSSIRSPNFNPLEAEVGLREAHDVLRLLKQNSLVNDFSILPASGSLHKF